MEITEAMIEAGLEVLAGYDRDFDADEVVVRKIFEAMWAKRPEPKDKE